MVLLNSKVLGAPPSSLTVTSALVAKMFSAPMSLAMLLSSISSCSTFIEEWAEMCLMRGVFLILVAKMFSALMILAMLLSSISSCSTFSEEWAAMCLMRGVFLILVAAASLTSNSMALVVETAGLWTTVYMWNLMVGLPFILSAVSVPKNIQATRGLYL